jgi:catechol 2,3-dioxygenase-like lactoylglutathione lyase family enzyme
MRPKTDGVVETSLYVEDVARSMRFYQEIFGFDKIAGFDERGCAMNAGTRQVLLLFKKGASRGIPSPHDGEGELHIAFAISHSEYEPWKAWLAQNEIAVEEERTWPGGGRSIYFRDPDRHLVEVVTPGTWSIY